MTRTRLRTNKYKVTVSYYPCSIVNFFLKETWPICVPFGDMADLCTIRCKSCAFHAFHINSEQPFTDISYIARWRGIILFIEN